MPTRDLDPVDSLVQLSFLVHARLARVAAAHELSLVQLRMFGVLRDREPGMLELARHLELEKSSLSGLVDRAEARGLVERVPSAGDRRATTVRMTARGRQLARFVTAEVESAIAELLAAVPARDRAQLAALAGRVVRGSGEMPEPIR